MKYLKTLCVFFLLLFSTGCGESSSSSSLLSDIVPGQTQQFSIGGTLWQVGLPAGWLLLEIPKGSTGVVLLASRGEANFVLLQKAGTQFASSDDILAEAAQDFDRFELLSKSTSSWIFKGKAEPQDPLRVFSQEVQTIPGTANYLYASCSYPAESLLAADCENIFKSFGKVVE